MKLVATRRAKERIAGYGGAIYVWPRAFRCCKGRQYVLEASAEPPTGEFELVHAADGFQVFATPGLTKPGELHLELDRSGRVRAYRNNSSLDRLTASTLRVPLPRGATPAVIPSRRRRCGRSPAR